MTYDNKRQRALDLRLAATNEWAQWAVDRWDGFPVEQVPRPLVIVGPKIRVDGGFASSDAKLAYMRGLIETSIELPEAVIAMIRNNSGQVNLAGPAPAPLLVTAAVRSSAEFMTDRGRVPLPAWRLDVVDATGPIWVLDPDTAAMSWEPPERTLTPRPSGQPRLKNSGRYAVLGADGQTLSYTFMGAAPTFERYDSAEVIRSAHAISVLPVGEDIGPPGYRTLVGHNRTVVVELDEPLGARVLVNLHGNAIEVRMTTGD